MSVSPQVELPLNLPSQVAAVFQFGSKDPFPFPLPWLFGKAKLHPETAVQGFSELTPFGFQMLDLVL